MHRLFVALRPPPAMRKVLLDAMSGVSGARWQSEDQLHLTLRFIGEVDGRTAEDVAAALIGVTQPRPAITLDGIGTFERRGIVHTIFARAAATEGLSALRGRINRALMSAGIAPEGRAFVPHVTLARLGRGGGPIAPMIERCAELTGDAADIDAFLLYESHLGRDGATYDAVARYPLA